VLKDIPQQLTLLATNIATTDHREEAMSTNSPGFTLRMPRTLTDRELA
jgi:hypothetical protein